MTADSDAQIGSDLGPSLVGFTPLMAAVIANDVRLVRTLLDAGADLSVSGSQFWDGPLTLATSVGSESVLSALLQASPPEDRSDPMRAAMAGFRGHAGIAGLVIDSCDAGERADVLQDMLVGAALAGDPGFLTWLMGAGARPDSAGSSGIFPLHNAVRSGSVEAIELLVEHGASVDCVDSGGMTPLFWLRSTPDRARIAKRLIAAGADVNAQMLDGASLVSYWAEEDDVVIVKLLLDAGADPRIPDEQGDGAIVRSQGECRELIRTWLTNGAAP